MDGRGQNGRFLSSDTAVQRHLTYENRLPRRKLLLAFYNYFAEAEREFISIRTKQGLAAARASGKKLGRPKGSRDKKRTLDPYREQIEEYLQLGLSLSRIRTILNPQLEKPISYPSYRYFVRQDAELLELWETQKGIGKSLADIYARKWEIPNNGRIFSKSLGQTSQKLWDKDYLEGEVFLKNYEILQSHSFCVGSANLCPNSGPILVQALFHRTPQTLDDLYP